MKPKHRGKTIDAKMQSGSRCARIRACLLATVMLLLAATQSWAGGGQHYPNGAEDFAVGALPPPGTYLVNYFVFTQKNSVKDNSGNNQFGSFKADVVAEVPRFIYVTPFTLLGANYAVHAFFPIYSAEVQAGTAATSDAHAPSSAVPSDRDIIDSKKQGLGDITFSPMILGWHFGPNLHAVAALDFIAPTGTYDNNRFASTILSRNHWTIEPVFAVSYFWEGFDISSKFMYDFNTSNDKFLNPGTGTVGKLSPGQEFHFDWALGYSAKNGLTGGLVGYNYWQTTDDEFNGVTVADNKSRIGGIGAGVKYWPNHGPFSMTLKHYWEYDARNIATGQQTFFKVIYAFQ